MVRRRIVACFGIALLSCLLVATIAVARAGGGGGSHGGGGGGSHGGGGGSSHHYSSSRSGGGSGGGGGAIAGLVFSVIVVIIVVAALQANKRRSVLYRMPTGQPVKNVPGYAQFMEKNPDFNEAAFLEKARTAFTGIQQAWQAQNLGSVRRFISDGVWQRFESQFRMMRALKQKNTIDKLKIGNIFIDRFDVDGSFDVANVAIQASIDDRFVCELDPALDSGGSEEFVEYWSFMKKRGSSAKDMYGKPCCPNCGGELAADMGESTKCPYCGSLTNSGAFDWVLTEITQAEDYIGIVPKLRSSSELSDKIAALVGESDDFAVQLLEDKASNGYLQLLIGRAFRDPSLIRRFVSDEVFERETAAFGKGDFVYNRLYLNDVTLLGVRQTETKNVLSVAIRSSFQRISLAGGKVEKIDPGVLSKTEILVFERDLGAGATKGSLYAHNCPNCGGPLENSLEMKCPWCAAVLNSTAREWIITGILTRAAYDCHLADGKPKFSALVDPDLLDKAWDVRDFAYNNILSMIAVDGAIADEEVLFVNAVAKKWGLKPAKLQEMNRQAQNLPIRMPEGLKQREKVFALMEKAAHADGRVDATEQKLLDAVEEEYLKPLRGESSAGAKG